MPAILNSNAAPLEFLALPGAMTAGQSIDPRFRMRHPHRTGNADRWQTAREGEDFLRVRRLGRHQLVKLCFSAIKAKEISLVASYQCLDIGQLSYRPRWNRSK
jgi:hypothetical protein